MSTLCSFILPAAAALVVTATSALGMNPQAGDTAAGGGRFVLSMGVSRQETNLTWSVGPSLEAALSELRYRGLVTNWASIGAAYQLGDRDSDPWVLGCELAIGDIARGRARDSDFSHGTETTRVESQVTGTDAWSATIAVGKRWLTSRHGQPHWLSLWLGWERWQQTLRMQNGTWVISVNPDTTSLSGLDSRYQARWRGIWAAVEPAFGAGGGHVLLRLAAHVAGSYSADGTWNLRADLAQPLSFTHSATGWGYDTQISYERPLASLLALTVSARYRHLQAGNGPDTTFLADGTTARLTLREMSLGTLGLGVSVAQSF